MFERFGDRARRVVVLAQEEARILSHNYIGTEHILLGLVHEGGGVATKALESLGISLEAVRQQVEEIVGEGQATPTGHVPFTPRAKKVLELSLRESIQLGHGYIGTEHILLGLLREGEGVAAQVLDKLGAGLDAARERVLAILESGAPPEGEPATQEVHWSSVPGGPSVERVHGGISAEMTMKAIRSSYATASRWLVLAAALAVLVTGTVGAALYPGVGFARALVAGGGATGALLIAAFALRMEPIPGPFLWKGRPRWRTR